MNTRRTANAREARFAQSGQFEHKSLEIQKAAEALTAPCAAYARELRAQGVDLELGIMMLRLAHARSRQ